MLAKQLEAILANEAGKTDLSHRSPADLMQRFQNLREYELLPESRGKNAQHLSLSEIVAGILSIATVKPGFSGLASKVLKDLLPVGGIELSFERCATFGKAIEAILDNPNALNSLIEIRLSDSEIYTNGPCRATIEYLSGDTKKTANYVGKLAVSLLQPGAEKTFDPRQLISSVITETVFYPQFFRRLDSELRKEMPELAVPSSIDPEEEDEEDRQKEERARRLGLTSSSIFLNVAVDNQVTWPHDETVVDFGGYKLILLPKTRENTTSVHIDLHGQRLTSEDALTLINRFLSVLTWCDDQFAVLQDGWSGNPVPVATPRRDLAFTTAHHWVFDRRSPELPEAKKAIAIYRDGRNAEQNYLVSYAVLSYYKIIELRHKGKSEAKTWFRDNFETLRQDGTLSSRIAAFEAACGTERPHDYLYRACRTAVAHANKPFSTDPDDFHELRRLHVAANILRTLARLFIQNELGVSDCSYDGT